MNIFQPGPLRFAPGEASPPTSIIHILKKVPRARGAIWTVDVLVRVPQQFVLGVRARPWPQMGPRISNYSIRTLVC